MAQGKAVLRPLALGAGGALVIGGLASMAGLKIPYADYLGAYVMGGPVGIVGKVVVDSVSGGGFALPGASVQTSNVVV
jgi:hypothetical protein